MFDPIRPSGSPSGSPASASSPETFYMRNAPEPYVKGLRQGVALVLNGILVMVALMTILILIAFVRAAPRGQPLPRSIEIASNFLMLIPSAMMALGYWKYSERDPVYRGADEPAMARQILRASTVAAAVMAVVNGVCSILGATPNVGAAMFANLGFWVIVSVILALIGLVIQIAHFLSAMKYTSWIGLRLADPAIAKRADQYMWLLPLIWVLGMFCLGLGPVIALVMYWTLLNRVRTGLAVIETGRAA